MKWSIPFGSIHTPQQEWVGWWCGYHYYAQIDDDVDTDVHDLRVTGTWGVKLLANGVCRNGLLKLREGCTYIHKEKIKQVLNIVVVQQAERNVHVAWTGQLQRQNQPTGLENPSDENVTANVLRAGSDQKTPTKA